MTPVIQSLAVGMREIVEPRKGRAIDRIVGRSRCEKKDLGANANDKDAKAGSQKLSRVSRLAFDEVAVYFAVSRHALMLIMVERPLKKKPARTPLEEKQAEFFKRKKNGKWRTHRNGFVL